MTSGSRLSPQGQGTGWGAAQGQQPRSRGNRLKISWDVRVSRLQEVGKNAECQEEEEAKGRRQSQLKAANRLVCLFSSLWPKVSQAAVPWAWVRGTGWPRPMGGRPQTPGCMPRTPLPRPPSFGRLVGGEQEVGTLWVKAKRTRLRRPCWEEENEPCASNLISTLLFCPCRAWAQVVQGLILVTELASPGATPEPSSACGGLLQGHQPREGTMAHTALGRRGSVRAYGGAKRSAGALAGL